MNYVYEYDIAAVLTVFAILVNLHRKKIFSTKTTKIFTTLLFLVGISSAIDIVSSFGIMNPLIVPLWLNKLLLCLYFINFTGIPFVSYLALVYSTGLYKKKIPKRRLIVIPYIIEVFLIIISPFAKTIFYFDEKLVYQHGFFFILLYVISVFYILIAVVISVINGKSLSKMQKNILYFYITICFLSLAIQILFPNIVIMGFIAAVSIFIIYLYIENPDNYIDKETDLYNKVALSSFISQQFESNKSFSVIAFRIIGLGFFTEVFNENIIIQLYHRLSAILQMSCGKKNVYRFSNNTFAVILKPDSKKLQTNIDFIKILFEEPIRIKDNSIHLTTKISYFNCPDAAASLEEVMDLIEYSLSSLINTNLTTVMQADKSLLQIKYHENYVCNKLRGAIKNDGLELVYKPIFSVTNQKLVAASTEIRFKETELQNLKSQELFSIAERNDIILKIDEIIINRLCEFLINNQDIDTKLKGIFITLSPIQFMQEQMSINVLDRITSHCNPKLLNFIFSNQSVELSLDKTEKYLKTNIESILKSGANISLENFGDFNSNIYDLIKYPFNIIKIDNSIISEAIFNDKAKDVLKSIIKIIKSLGMKILVNGIETKEQFELALDFNCDYAEGNYFSSIISESDLLKLLQEAK